MRAPSDLVEVESAREEPKYDWSGWEKWLRAHLDIEREDMIESLGDGPKLIERQRKNIT
jgi:hypothetical protein